jgi:hypothetical protein
LVQGFLQKVVRFSHGGEQTTTTKKIKRMSKDLDANNLADALTGFQND